MLCALVSDKSLPKLFLWHTYENKTASKLYVTGFIAFFLFSDWITNDLLTKIEKNDSLSKRFSDARFMQALEEFQKDPEGAMQKYKGNEDVERFLQEFCGLLGE